MRTSPARTAAASKRARNPLLRVLSSLRSARQRRRSRTPDAQELAQLDPDQRVRALGEW